MKGAGLVLIAGGGPVGLLCALLLGRQGVPVRLFDKNPELQVDPRAATTHPATLDVLAEAGLTDDMIRVGLVARNFQFWDRVSGSLVADFDHALLAGDTAFPYVVQCEQFKTARLILDRLLKMPNVEVLFGHEVTEIDIREDRVTATVPAAGKTSSHSGSYLIGADGGRSTVRKGAGIAFEGFTYEERFLVLTTPFDFGAKLGYSYRNYFADPDEWCNCFKVAHDGPPGLWRTVFPADPAVSEAETLSDEAVQARMQKFFPSGEPYEIVHRNLYITHQRVAETFRKGRVMLAGDSAHINNSIGGMGLNGGLQDAANLCQKLGPVALGEGAEELLDLYSLQRRTVTTEFVQAQTIANKKRLEAKDPEQRERNFKELRETSRDPERARRFLLNSSMISMQRRAASIGLTAQ